MQDNLERQLEELEVLEAIYPDELTVDASRVSAVKQVLRDNPDGVGDGDVASHKLPTLLSLTIKLGRLANLEYYSGKPLKYAHPSITVEFPLTYPESSPPLVTKTVGLCAEITNVIPKYLDAHSGEECIMQLIMSINERIEEQNERTVQDYQNGVEKKEQTLKANTNIDVVVDSNEAALPIIGRRIINSPYILKPAKIKDIKKCADELKLGGYAKVGKPGIIVIEGPEEGCKQYCPMLENRGWKYQKVQGEQQEEGVAGTSIDEMRLLNSAGEFKVLGEDTMSELSQLCREAGLADLFFTSLNIHNSVGSDDKDGNNKKGARKKSGKR